MYINGIWFPTQRWNCLALRAAIYEAGNGDKLSDNRPKPTADEQYELSQTV